VTCWLVCASVLSTHSKMERLARDAEKEGRELTQEEQAQFMKELAEGALNTMLKLNCLDIEQTLNHVCRHVLKGKDLPVEKYPPPKSTLAQVTELFKIGKSKSKQQLSVDEANPEGPTENRSRSVSPFDLFRKKQSSGEGKGEQQLSTGERKGENVSALREDIIIQRAKALKRLGKIFVAVSKSKSSSSGSVLEHVPEFAAHLQTTTPPAANNLTPDASSPPPPPAGTSKL